MVADRTGLSPPATGTGLPEGSPAQPAIDEQAQKMRLVSLMALSRLWFAGVIVPTLIFCESEESLRRMGVGVKGLAPAESPRQSPVSADADSRC